MRKKRFAVLSMVAAIIVIMLLLDSSGNPIVSRAFANDFKPSFCFSEKIDDISSAQALLLPLRDRSFILNCQEVQALAFGTSGQAFEAAKKHQADIAKKYEDVRKYFLELRDKLKSKERGEAIKLVQEMLPYALAGVAFPPWLGTEWNFYGSNKKPSEGSIACGYFVAATLYAVGFNVKITLETSNQRHYRIAGLISEEIVKKLAGSSSIRRFSNRPLSEVVDKVKEMGAGVYVIGLDCHVAFLVYEEGGPVWLWHSKPNHEVRLEKPEDDPFVANSKYRVIGKLDSYTAELWLDGKSL